MQPFCFEQIDNPGREWVVWSDNGELNPVSFGKAHELRQIVRGHRNVLGNFLRAGISGRAKDTIGLRRLRQFPRQGVLATSVADDENFHRSEGASAGSEKQAGRREFVEGILWVRLGLRRASPYQ